MNSQQLSKIDYDHWCKQVNRDNVKVFKNEVCYFDRILQKEVCINKSKLQPSPIKIDIDINE